MKLLLIVAALAFALPVYGQEKSPQSDSHEQRAQDKIETTPPRQIAPSNSGVVINQQTSPEQKDRAASSSNTYFSRLFSPENLPSIGLLLATVVGIAVAIRTLRTLVRQTEATEVAAKAAMLNAQALVSSERARVIVELVPQAIRSRDNQWCRFIGGKPVHMTEDEILAGRHLRYTMKLTNMGRTPAEILSFRICYSHLPNGARELPQDDVGELLEEREFDHLLGPADSIEIQEPMVDVNDNLGRSIEEIRAIRELRTTLVVHGLVRYRHIFSGGDTETSEFCYAYSPVTDRLNKVSRPKTTRADN